MGNKKIDNLYAALMLIEILLEKGLINQSTYDYRLLGKQAVAVG